MAAHQAAQMAAPAAWAPLNVMGILLMLASAVAASSDQPQCLYAGAGISFYGADMDHEQLPAASASTCCYLCANTPRCIAFEWNPAVAGGTCFLKNSAGVVPRPLEGAQAGVLVLPGSAISAAAIHSNNVAASGAGVPLTESAGALQQASMSAAGLPPGGLAGVAAAGSQNGSQSQCADPQQPATQR